MDLSIVIVNYNTKALTEQTVNSVIATTNGIDYEIIVVDNSSNTREYYNSSDSRVKVLDKHRDVGCLGIKTLLRDGTFDHGCKRGFPTPFNSLCYVLKLDKIFPKVKKFGGYTLNYLSQNETNEVDSVSGAFMLIPKSVIGKVGLFDESIFMYGEDIDLCYRIKMAGFKVVYYADVWMTHLKGQSGLHTKSPVVIKHFHDGIKRFYDMYYKDRHNFIVTFLMHSAINLRYIITLGLSKIRR